MSDDEGDAGHAPAAPAGTPFYLVLQMAEDLHDSLEVLEYTSTFCKKFDAPPIHSHYFAFPMKQVRRLHVFEGRGRI
jgi:hypothetical protein